MVSLPISYCLSSRWDCCGLSNPSMKTNKYATGSVIPYIQKCRINATRLVLWPSCITLFPNQTRHYRAFRDAYNKLLARFSAPSSP